MLHSLLMIHVNGGHIMSDIKQKIMQMLKQPVLGSFATVDENQKPWTRYVVIFTDENMKMRVATFINSRKIKQIQANPEVHLCCGVNDLNDWNEYLQIQGRATIDTSLEEKAKLWNPHFAEIFKGPDDPDYAIIIIEPYKIERYEIGKDEPEVWQA